MSHVNVVELRINVVPSAFMESLDDQPAAA